jgi:hypothetical protein
MSSVIISRHCGAAPARFRDPLYSSYPSHRRIFIRFASGHRGWFLRSVSALVPELPIQSAGNRIRLNRF